MQAVQQRLNQFKAAYNSRGEHYLVAYFSQHEEPKKDKDMWVVSLRDCVNHRDHNTTSVAEGWHSSIKLWGRGLEGENLRPTTSYTYPSKKLAACLSTKTRRGFLMKLDETQPRTA
jgi:hypothetical protein